MNETKAVKLFRSLAGWIGLGLLTFRHSKKLMPELEAAGRKIYLRLSLIYMEYVIINRIPVLFGRSSTVKRLILSAEDKKLFVATRLSKNFLFRDESWIVLQTIAADHIFAGGAK